MQTLFVYNHLGFRWKMNSTLHVEHEWRREYGDRQTTAAGRCSLLCGLVDHQRETERVTSPGSAESGQQCSWKGSARSCAFPNQ